jgi:hypothetical protein
MYIPDWFAYGCITTLVVIGVIKFVGYLLSKYVPDVYYQGDF